MSHMKVCGAVLAAAFFTSLAISGTASAALLSGPKLVAQLRQGGYVLLMRHARSPLNAPAPNLADPENTADERQLDDKGKSSARAMGEAIRALHIPIGSVLSSPTYRALQTVRLARLGTPKTFAQLGDGGQSMQAGAVSGQAAWLRDRVSQPPPAGSDTVIVTQMPNIVAAFGDMATGLKDGEALILRPQGQGRSELIAKVEIEDWPVLARSR